jgi:hypothetical protein
MMDGLKKYSVGFKNIALKESFFEKTPCYAAALIFQKLEFHVRRLLFFNIFFLNEIQLNKKEISSLYIQCTSPLISFRWAFNDVL